MKMRVFVSAVVFSILGQVAFTQLNPIYATVQRSNQLPSTPLSTTMKPYDYSTISLSPHTSISVHHSVVRNKPAYPYPPTDATLMADGSEDTNYYYTYEESSEETTRKYMMNPPSTTPLPTTRPTVRSFWNSQKALLDARRKESSQKYVSTYSRSTSKTEKPKIEFKVREKPKFGLANKNKLTTTTIETSDEDKVPTTTAKSVKFNSNNANLADSKSDNKEDSTKSSTKETENGLPNQIIGRVGEIPLPSSHPVQIQTPLYQQAAAGNSRQSKFDDSVGTAQYIDVSSNIPINQQEPRNVYTSLQNSGNNRNLNNKHEALMLDILKRQQEKLTSSQPLPAPTASQSMDPNEFIKQLLSQSIVPTSNQPRSNPIQQQSINTNQLIQNQNKIPQSNSNLQNSLGNFNQPQTIIASLPLGNSMARSGEIYSNGNGPVSTLLSRLGNLGLNLGGESAASNYIMGRDGGSGKAVSVNLGLPDPISILLKLISLIPRPLLDLNGRLFFGVELGKNAGLTTKPVG